MVYRIYTEKKEHLAEEAHALCGDLKKLLGIKGLERIRILNRYDAENLDRDLFCRCIPTVFSEPQTDLVSEELPQDAPYRFAVEYLPGQFDQRADSAAQCISFISQQKRPTVRTAKIYLLYGNLTAEDIATIKNYVINPVECREAQFETFETLDAQYEIPQQVKTIEGFCEMTEAEIAQTVTELGLAMDVADALFCRDYFRKERRDPTITEIRMIDTYWSDHCRHTTFTTTIDNVSFADPLLEQAYQRYLQTRKDIGRTKPINFMDIATIAVKYLKQNGKLDRLDESEEINACTVKIDVEVDGVTEPWLLLFKNETHNHPTEIEPFGGAATCIGGAIRDPLSGRAYVYAAMRVTGAANPLTPVNETIAGKLPQRKIVTTAAAGYSAYGNQIGLATGQVSELYHPGYAAKRMEIGAVVGAVPQNNVRRECPNPGDVVILLGGKTGRDGCGGATGSSKAHDTSSLTECGAEVQKGNAPEERKLQRLFRNPEAVRMIKRCNDFGAGGVSVAVGELADGLFIDLNSVPKKYEGLDGTELAISESQERMAVVIEAKDVQAFCALADKENIEATKVADVTDTNRLVMVWNGKNIVDISRDFLNSNGAEKHITIDVAAASDYQKAEKEITFTELLSQTAKDLNTTSTRGLTERFDSTIGAGTVLAPLGGKYQNTPLSCMVHKISVEKGHTNTCSLMSWGFNPYVTEKSPYHGAYLAVVESVCKLIAAGTDFSQVYLTFQEYFKKPGQDPARWGQPMAALLGAFCAQMDYGIGSVGGKDSMSGSFEDLDVPPTLVSFAVSVDKTENIISPEFKGANNKIGYIAPKYTENGLPDTESMKKVFETVTALIRSRKVVSVYTVGMGGVIEAIMKMTFGNKIGAKLNGTLSNHDLSAYCYGAFVLELTEDADGVTVIGETCEDFVLANGTETVCGETLLAEYESVLSPIYPICAHDEQKEIPAVTYKCEKRSAPTVKVARPRVLIPVFPGTNCEYDSAKAFRDAGADVETFVIRNLTPQAITESVNGFKEALKKSQIMFVPGGFSGGDEPDGSGKFITAFMRAKQVKEEIMNLLRVRDGLILGICNGFQALIKLGLVPFGEIVDTDESCPTLTYNTIARHQSGLVRTRVASNLSPWLAHTEPGDIFTVPISHGEGRFYASEEMLEKLVKNGQIATQYVDVQGNPTNEIRFNPNGSYLAVEGITSPDGRVFGKMGHTERMGTDLYKNVPGNYDTQMFASAVRYFKD